MGHIITDLKEAFRRGNVYIQLIFINVGVFVITTLIGILLQFRRYLRAAGFAGFFYPICMAAMVYLHLHVHACGISAHPVQHAMALLVRGTVSVFLLGQAPERPLYSRRNLRRTALYDFL